MSSSRTTFLLCLHTQSRKPSSRSPTIPTRSSSLLSRMLPNRSKHPEPHKCSDSYIDSLCPKCLSVFRSRNIDLPEARLRILEYRLMYQYNGRLRPVVAGSSRSGGTMILISQDDEPIAQAELLLQEQEVGRPGFTIPRKPGNKPELNAGFWSRFTRDAAGSLTESEEVYLSHLEAWWRAERDGGGRQESSGSTTTTTEKSSTSAEIIWPSFGRTLSGEFDTGSESPLTQEPSRSSRPTRPIAQEEVDIGTQSLSNWRRSVDRYFVIGDTRPENSSSSSSSSASQVASSKSSDHFVNPSKGRNERVSHKSSPHLARRRLETQPLYLSGGGLPPPDLDKPLPPIPRPDTPIPGAPFNSDVPDRDLPRGRYYRRVL